MSVKRKVTVPSGGRSRFEPLPEPVEAARDPARDRAGREPELLADRPVALVAAEEAVEHLVALLGQLPSASRTANASSSSSTVVSIPAGSASDGSSRLLAAIRSRHTRRVSCAIQGRSASGFRSVSSRP